MSESPRSVSDENPKDDDDEEEEKEERSESGDDEEEERSESGDDDETEEHRESNNKEEEDSESEKSNNDEATSSDEETPIPVPTIQKTEFEMYRDRGHVVSIVDDDREHGEVVPDVSVRNDEKRYLGKALRPFAPVRRTYPRREVKSDLPPEDIHPKRPLLPAH